jgi:hypothetical protein
VLKKRILFLSFSVLVSVGLIWVLLSKIETKDLFDTYMNIFIPALLVYFILSLIGSFLRAWRYKLLLTPHKITWGNILLVTFVRNLFADLLPLRIGSLSYILVLNARLKYSFNAAASSFVVALVYDFLSLSPFLVFSILAVGFGKTPLSTPLLLLFSLLFFLLLLAIVWKLPEFCSVLVSVYGFVLKRLKADRQKWAQISVEKIRSTISDIHELKKRKTDWPAFFLSMSIRSAKYGALYFLLFALLQSHGYSLSELSFWITILGVTGAELTGYFPIKGIWGFGTWEAGWASTLSLLGFDSNTAIISSGVHLITNLWEFLFGVASLLVLALFHSRKKEADILPKTESEG